jgi:RNA polymerase sigma-70 factor (ECF subfamily)
MPAVASGDLAALGQIVERHQGRVLRLARRITGDANLADDVAQEAFLRVYRAAARYEPSARFTTWLHRIVVNLCWDQRRRWRHPGPEAGSVRQESVADPVQGLVTGEARQAVRRAVQGLPSRQRLAVILHRFEGHTMREIAGITGWSESAVESCLVRAYRQLRGDLAEFDTRPGEKTPQDDRAPGV